MRKLALITVFLVCVAVVYYSIQISPEPQAELRYPIFSSPRTLDPAKAAWSDDIRIVWSLWEGLTAYDPVDCHIIEGAASLPPEVSPDGLVYTFDIKSDARWSNGDRVTAKDFIYGWRRAIEPGSSGEYIFLITDNIAGAGAYSSWRHEAIRLLKALRDLSRQRPVADEDRALLIEKVYQGIEPQPVDWKSEFYRFRKNHLDQIETRFEQVGLRALSETRLEVRLVRPIAYFTDLLAFVTFMPIHRVSIELLRESQDEVVHDLTLWAFDPQWTKPDWHRNGYPGLISNGAYRLADWQFKRFLHLQSNPEYHERQDVSIDRVLIRIIPDSASAFLAYEKGELDWIRNVDTLDYAPSLLQLQAEGKRDDIHVCNAYGTYFYDFNCRDTLADGTPNPFRDPLIRQAFTLAINKSDLAGKVKKTGNGPAHRLIPPNTIAGYHCEAGPDLDVVRARQLLEEAGYPNGDGLPTIEILLNNDSNHGPIAEAVAEMWEKNLGVNVVIMGKELKTFDADLVQGRFMVARHGWYGDYADPTTFLDLYTTGNGQNNTGFSNPEYDGLMQEAANTLDAAKRLEILARAETMLNQEQFPILPMFYYVNMVAVKPYIKGFEVNPREINPLKYISIEK